MELPKFSKPKNFLEFGLSLRFNSQAAKNRMMAQIQNCGDEGVPLGKPMIDMDIEKSKAFPPVKDLPVLFDDIENMDMSDLSSLVGDDQIKLHIEASVDEWVMDFTAEEPRKLKALTEEECVDFNHDQALRK